MALGSASAQVSQKTAFLIFLAVVIFAGPYLYTILTGTVFVASPDWISKYMMPTMFVSAVLALLSIPFFLRAGKRRWSVCIMGPICIAAFAIFFVLFSLPVILAKLSPTSTSYDLTVSSTERKGKVRCEYPFSVAEISQTFCATSAADYQQLKPGTKIEVFGQGNEYGLFVDGYRLDE